MPPQFKFPVIFYFFASRAFFQSFFSPSHTSVLLRHFTMYHGCVGNGEKKAALATLDRLCATRYSCVEVLPLSYPSRLVSSHVDFVKKNAVSFFMLGGHKRQRCLLLFCDYKGKTRLYQITNPGPEDTEPTVHLLKFGLFPYHMFKGSVLECERVVTREGDTRFVLLDVLILCRKRLFNSPLSYRMTLGKNICDTYEETNKLKTCQRIHSARPVQVKPDDWRDRIVPAKLVEALYHAEDVLVKPEAGMYRPASIDKSMFWLSTRSADLRAFLDLFVAGSREEETVEEEIRATPEEEDNFLACVKNLHDLLEHEEESEVAGDPYIVVQRAST